jgi:hypothetical protein
MSKETPQPQTSWDDLSLQNSFSISALLGIWPKRLSCGGDCALVHCRCSAVSLGDTH